MASELAMGERVDLQFATRDVGLRVGLFLLAVVFLMGCEDKEIAPKPIRPVLTQTVQFQPYWQESSYAGDVRARYETALGFRISGKIIERLVEVGDEVEAGTDLARLDPADYRLRLSEAAAELAAAKAQYNKASTDLDRYAALLKKQVVSHSEFTNYRNAFDVAKARLEQAEAELEVTRRQTEYTTLQTDSAGVVTALEAEVGQVVGAGQTVVRLALSGSKEAVIAVPEHRLEDLRAADDIRISLWALPGKIYTGAVREISPGADPVTRTYRIRISIEDAGPEVQLGMTANALVKRQLHQEVVQLPLSAIFQKDGKPAVWVVDAAALNVGLVPVDIVQYRQDGALIRSGLNNGQVVVTAGVHKLVPGQRVRLLAEAGES